MSDFDAASYERSYWDRVSVQDKSDGKETIKDLIQEAYETALPMMNELIFIEGDAIYLNLVCGVPQTTIAEIYKMSQLGVSKRVRSGVKKMKTILCLPETDLLQVNYDMYNLLGKDFCELAAIYYNTKIFAVSAQILNIRPSTARNRMHQALYRLKELHEKDFISTWYRNLGDRTYYDTKLREYHESLKDEDIVEMEKLKAYRYLTYFEDIIQQSNYGDFHFKAMSSKFIKKLDASKIIGLEE